MDIRNRAAEKNKYVSLTHAPPDFRTRAHAEKLHFRCQPFAKRQLFDIICKGLRCADFCRFLRRQLKA